MCCVSGWEVLCGEVSGCVVWDGWGGVLCGWVLKDDMTELIIMPHWIVGVARYSHHSGMIQWCPVCNLSIFTTAPTFLF